MRRRVGRVAAEDLFELGDGFLLIVRRVQVRIRQNGLRIQPVQFFRGVSESLHFRQVKRIGASFAMVVISLQ